MKKWIKIILIFLILISVLVTINMYLKNKTINNKENKGVSTENVILNEKTEEEILVNSNTETGTNITNSQIEENENNTIGENIVQKETKSNDDDQKDRGYQEDKIKDNDNNAKNNEKNNIVNNNLDDTKEDKNVAENNQSKTNTKKTIVIDPGHQAKGDSSKEPIGPGATETKAKVTTGATGISTKQKESELVFEVSLLLEKALKQQGYNVIMTRTTNNVNISNQERATIANNANADAFIRIHADSYDNSTVNRNINIMPNTK